MQAYTKKFKPVNPGPEAIHETISSLPHISTNACEMNAQAYVNAVQTKGWRHDRPDI
jgi:hypothetical protein